jgi:TonB family protein
VLRRLDFLKRGIAARPLTRTALGMFAVLALAVLTGLSGLSLAVAAEKEQPQARAVDSSGYLMYAEVMPKVKFVPPRPEMPSEVVRTMVANGDTTLVTRLEFFVDETGAVNRELTRVTNASVFPELDRIALEWARQMTFEPALDKGKPVRVRMAIPVQWKAK